MLILLRTMFTCIVVLTLALSVGAQIGDSQAIANSSSMQGALSAPDTINVELPYMLGKGDNEFGFWAGGGFKATTAFGGLTAAEARDRKLFLAAFRYGRTLLANDSVALQYTLDVIPVALAMGNIVSINTVGPVTTFQRETTYGAGLTPIGVQVDFANGSRVHPFVHVNGGALIFTKPAPLPDSGRFGFVGEAGTGVRIFTSQRRAVTLGMRFHHISNGDRTGTNRGLNQFVFYAGFSVFK